MISRTIKVLGFELNFFVPADVAEYNALAPKRENPVLEDAIQNVLYRNVYNKIRDAFVTKIEEVTGLPRNNAGTEDEPKWESEAKYTKRALVAEAEKRGLDPAKAADTNKIMADWLPYAQAIADTFKFDPSETERTGNGGSLVSKEDTTMAENAVKEGKAEKLAAMLTRLLGTEVTANVKSLAGGLNARRKKMANEERARLAAELAATE